MKSPRRLDNRNSRASERKASSSLECSAERSRESTKLTFYCVGNHEQPRRGVRLFASTSPAGPASAKPKFLGGIVELCLYFV